MIDVVGQDADAVKKALVEVGLTPVIEYEESSEYAKDIVIRCSVSEGARDPLRNGSDPYGQRRRRGCGGSGCRGNDRSRGSIHTGKQRRLCRIK